MTLRVIHRPLWHYIILLWGITYVILKVLDAIIYLISQISNFKLGYLTIFFITSSLWPLFSLLLTNHIWKRFVKVTPSASFAYEWNDGPWLHYISNPENSIVINWISNKITDTEIEFGTDINRLNQVKKAKSRIHRVYLENLQPDTTYFYRINNTNSDKLYSFRTAPEVNRQFAFVVFGDTQNGGGYGQKNWAYPYIIDGLLKESFELMFIMGDATDQGNDIKSWHAFLEQSSKIAQNHPMHITVGNHDTGTQFLHDKSAKKYPDDGANFDFLLGYKYQSEPNENRITPFKSRYYSIDYLNCRFLFLDTQNSTMAEPRNPQWKWLENKLKECPPNMWKIAFVHRTPIEIQTDEKGNYYYKESKFGQYLIPLFEKYNLNMLIAGHAHLYQHIEKSIESSPHKIHYFISGAAGNEIRKNEPISIPKHLEGFKYRENSSHYLLIKVDMNQLTIEAKYPDNSIIDHQKIVINLLQ